MPNHLFKSKNAHPLTEKNPNWKQNLNKNWFIKYSANYDAAMKHPIQQYKEEERERIFQLRTNHPSQRREKKELF